VRLIIRLDRCLRYPGISPYGFMAWSLISTGTMCLTLLLKFLASCAALFNHIHTKSRSSTKEDLNRNKSLKDTVPWSRITPGKLFAQLVKKFAALHGTRDFSDVEDYAACLHLGLGFFK
jgi:hypothetical protein